MKAILTLSVVLLLCIQAKGDIALPPGSTHVEHVFDASQLVCSCSVKAVVDHAYPLKSSGESVNRHEVTAQITVVDAYKIEDPRVTEVVVEYVMDEQQGQRIAGSRLALVKGETVLLFLTATGRDTYQFADPFIGATHFASLPVGEDSGLAKLQRVLATVVRTAPPTDQLRGLQLLLGFDHIDPITLSTVMPLTQSDKPEVALTAIGVLLRTKSLDSLKILERYLASHVGGAEPLAVYVIGPELRQIADENALPELESLTDSRFRSIRDGALDAIRKIRSPKSVPFLMAKLNDSDSNVQYVALISTAEIVGKDHDDFAPSMFLFDQKPQYYVGLWKQWWATEGRKQYAADTTHE